MKTTNGHSFQHELHIVIEGINQFFQGLYQRRDIGKTKIRDNVKIEIEEIATGPVVAWHLLYMIQCYGNFPSDRNKTRQRANLSAFSTL